MIKLKELVKHHCECGNDCCSVNESQQDKARAQKKFQSLMMKQENWFMVCLMTSGKINFKLKLHLNKKKSLTQIKINTSFLNSLYIYP